MQEPMDQFQDAAPAMSLREYGDILRRRRAIILQVFVLVFVAGVLVTLFQAPTYTAKARLLVEAPTPIISTVTGSDPLAELFRANRMYSILTQVELLQSSDIRKRVSEKLGGSGRLPFLQVQAVDGTQIIEVTAEGENPELVAAAPNTLLDLYVRDVGDNSTGDLSNAIKFAQQELTAAEKKLKSTEKRLQDFKEQNRVPDLAANRETLLNEIHDLETAYQQAQANQRAVQARIAETQAQMNKRQPTNQAVLNLKADPAMQSIENELVMLDVREEGLKEVFTERHPEMRAILRQRERLRKRQKELQDTANARNVRVNPEYAQLGQQLSQLYVDAAGLTAQSSNLLNRISEANARLKNFPQWETQLAQMTRELEQARDSYKMFTSRLEDLRLRFEVKRVNAHVIERAEPPMSPIRPKKAQNILFAGILGIFFGLCLALLQEFMDDRINSPDEVDRVLRLPNLGYIPMIEEQGLRLIRDIHAFSPIVESYRGLRTNINFAAIDRPLRSLLVTSSSPGEGKSTTCANLAMAMALDGKRVIVVDADLRRPSQHRLFNIQASPGLTDILIGTHSVSEVIRPTNIDRVQIIPAGSVPPNPAELLGSEAMGHFIETLQDMCDVVLFDSPPALAVSDAILLSSRVDGVLLVVSYGETKKAAARQAFEMLNRARANVLGTVLNKLGGKGGGYYYYYYRGKYYAPVTENRMRGELNPGGGNGNGNGAAAVTGEDAQSPAAAAGTPSATAALPGGSSSAEEENR